MAFILYNIGVFCYVISIRIAAFWNTKARQWVVGRRGWQQRYQADWQRVNPENKPCVWVHCASLGEFEQGRPVIERLKRYNADIKILLTFFSPSGYEIRKNYPQADYICYLPTDTAANAAAFLHIFQPCVSIFVKYEFWYHYLTILQQKKGITLLISALFRPGQIFFKWYGGLFRKILHTFQHIFTQNQLSADLLQAIGVQNITVAGDTRIDRVLEIARDAPAFPAVDHFADRKNIFIIGSSWQADEAILLPFIHQHLPEDWKVIIAPHDIAETHLAHLEKHLMLPSIRYSHYNINENNNVKVLLIDNIGMLAALYRYGRVVYIGGGFGTGIHNTLEPIAFGLPVLFGPKFQKFTEAVQLVQQGGAFVVKNSADLQPIFQSLRNAENWQRASDLARRYVLENQGATDKILAFFKKDHLLSDGDFLLKIPLVE